MIAIFDYGSGNLRSAQRAFERTGENVIVTSDLEVARKSKGLVVPGVGAFAACMNQLLKAGGEELIKGRSEKGEAIFGICVGMQVLFSKSTEKGNHEGLGIFEGSVDRLKSPILPQIGWNTVATAANSNLFKGIEDSSFYFVHSYAAHTEEESSANSYTTYGEPFLAAVERENVVATQFHPEKSGGSGLRLIKNWVATL